MIKVSVEVLSGTARFGVAVWARSIEDAVGLVHARYPGGKTRVVFPIDGEAFFARGPLPASGMVLPEQAEQAAV